MAHHLPGGQTGRLHAKSPLLLVQRDVLAPARTGFGCGTGYCAACIVLIDRRNIAGRSDKDARMGMDCSPVAELMAGVAAAVARRAAGVSEDVY